MGRDVLAGVLLIVAILVVYFRKKGVFNWPVVGRITSPFGTRTAPIAGASTVHNGIDIAASDGTPIAAPAPGTVSSISTTTLGGKQLSITHTNGLTTGYAHLSKYAVKVGDSVTTGQLIGYTGSTGNVTGPHLHFSVKNESGVYVNPLDYLS